MSDKKTVEDAMDYYKYIASNHEYVTCIVCNESTGSFGFLTSGMMVPHGFYIVGYIKEFEDYAKMMELNKLNKEAVNIEVKIPAQEPSEPEFGVFKRSTDPERECEITKIKIPEDKPTISYISTEEYRDFNFDADAFNVEFVKNWVENNIQFTGAKEAVKPVYTQEMADNYEVPTIGSYIDIFRNSNGANVAISVLVKYSSEEHCIVLVNGDELSFPPYYYHYKPVDTRTDEEKLIDEVAELINDHIDDDVGSKCLAKEIINKLK